MKLIRIFCILIAFLSACNAYRILAVFPLSAKSHSIIFQALMKGLAKRGHQVDVVSHYPLKKPVKNYNDIINLQGSMEMLMNNLNLDAIQQINGDVIEAIAVTYGNRICNSLGLKEMQKLVKNPPTDPPYDLVIAHAFGSHCFMGLGYVFNVPVVAVATLLEFPWMSDFMGSNDNFATVPHSRTSQVGKMNFWERLNNLIDYHRAVFKFHAITEQNQTESMRKYLRSDIPNIREVEKNVALTLVINHPILFGVKPVPPSVVQIAGLHIETNEEILSPELEKWMNESTQGVVYFSLGSLVIIESLPTETLNQIFDSFKKIAPVRVLMKVTDPSKLPSGLPKNVKTLPWIPQIPILAHPNTKVFITHCGLGGLQEALYFGVPLIGMPLFSDQFKNSESFIKKGMLVRMDINKFSGKQLDSALEEILTNPSYKEKALYYSRLFRDQPMTPLNNAIFWIEYIIRNGGDVLRSPALQYTWWQLDLLDVYGFLLLVLILFIALIILSIRMVMRLFRKAPPHNNQKKKKAH